MPLQLFRSRNLSTANGISMLWAAAMFAWFFLSAQYLQFVLHYRPLKVGLAFLPANLIMGGLSIGVSAKLVMRFGIKRPMAVGLVLAGIGLALFDEGAAVLPCVSHDVIGDVLHRHVRPQCAGQRGSDDAFELYAVARPVVAAQQLHDVRSKADSPAGTTAARY